MVCQARTELISDFNLQRVQGILLGVGVMMGGVVVVEEGSDGRKNWFDHGCQ